MTTIYKYELLVGFNEIDIPGEFACPLSVYEQNEKLCLWARVDTAKPSVKRHFAVVGTGWNLDDRLDLDAPKSIEKINWNRFIGTVVCGTFVWHVFEVTP